MNARLITASNKINTNPQVNRIVALLLRLWVFLEARQSKKHKFFRNKLHL